jgi:hypothetical protein
VQCGPRQLAAECFVEGIFCLLERAINVDHNGGCLASCICQVEESVRGRSSRLDPWGHSLDAVPHKTLIGSLLIHCKAAIK